MRVQMDTSANDKSEIVERYADAQAISMQFKITAYPTALFMSPNGKLIGRSTGTVKWQRDFIEIAMNAMQYPDYVAAYREGRNDSSFLRQLALDGVKVDDTATLSRIGGDYLRTVKNPFRKDNLQVIVAVTKSSRDSGFQFVRMNREVVDDSEHLKGFSIRLVGNIIKRELIMPALQKGTDWTLIYIDVVRQYPDVGDEVVRFFHVANDIQVNDWADFGGRVVDFMNRYYHRWDNDGNFFNALAYYAFLHCDEQPVLKAALVWARQSLSVRTESFNLDTYANLLYKLKRKDEAIEWERKAVAADQRDSNLKECLKKMEAGERTW